MSFMSSGFDGARASLARRPQESIPRGSIYAPVVVRHACLPVGALSCLLLCECYTWTIIWRETSFGILGGAEDGQMISRVS